MQSRLPNVVFVLLIANLLGFLGQYLWSDELVWNLALWPAGTPNMIGNVIIPSFQPWQLLTYGFLHGGLMHLAFNLYGLWLFGRAMELTWGSKRFAIYYIICVLGAGLVQLLVTSTQVNGIADIYPTIGASGGVFGILLAYGMTYPNQRLMLLIPPIPIKAKWFVIIYGAIELFLGVTGTQQGVAHFAHLGGMAFGAALIWHWRKTPPPRPPSAFGP